MLLFSPAESGESHGTAPCANLYCGPLLWALLRIVASLVMLPSNTATTIVVSLSQIRLKCRSATNVSTLNLTMKRQNIDYGDLL